MGQLQRDDSRRAQQETVELWEIEREIPRSLRQRQSMQSQQRRRSAQENRPRQERESEQTGRSRQERKPEQRRQSSQERRLRQEREPEQIRRARREEQSRQEREPERRRRSRQEGRPRQERELEQRRRSRQEGRPRQERELQQIGVSRQEGRSRQGRLSHQPRRAEYARPASYRQGNELQLVSGADYRQAGNPRPVQSIKRRRARRRKVLLSRAGVFLFIILCLVLIYQTTGAVYRFINRDMEIEVSQKDKSIMSTLSDKVDGKKIAPPEIMEDYLEINDYSRPGTELKKVNSVFVHYTANPGTSAQNNRSYFANLAETHERAASAHLIIGYEGELLQCIPLDEQAYGVKGRNEDSLSIECCYLAEDGSFTSETYETLLHTLAWLLDEYDLTTEDILRHYDCGGKKCPLYYVEHEDAWEKLLADVAAYEVSAE